MDVDTDNNAVLVELSAGFDSNILRFSDQEFIDNSENVLKSIFDDAEKLISGPATLRCAMQGEKVEVNVDNLCTLLAYCRADQGDEGIVMLFMVVEPKEEPKEEYYETADEEQDAEKEEKEPEPAEEPAAESAPVEEPPSESAPVEEPKAPERAAENETDNGENNRGENIAKKPKLASSDEEEPAKHPVTEETTDAHEQAWTKHISTHIMQMLTNQLYGMDARKVLPQIAVKIVQFLANYNILQYPDSLIQICEGKIEFCQQCIYDGIKYAKAVPQEIREELVSMVQVWILEIKQEGMAKTSVETHPNIICDMCEMSPIVGKRYKSRINRDFDLCENCIQHDDIALYDQIEGQTADVVSFSYSSTSSDDNNHVAQTVFTPGARTTTSPTTTTKTTTTTPTTTTKTTTTTTKSTVQAATPATQSTVQSAAASTQSADDVGADIVGMMLLALYGKVTRFPQVETLIPLLMHQVIIVAELLQLPNIPQSFYRIRDGDLRHLVQAAGDGVHAFKSVDLEVRQIFVNEVIQAIDRALQHFDPAPEKEEPVKNTPEVLACEVSNSCVHPGDLEGPVVDMINKDHNLDGAFLVGQFKDGPGVAKIRLRNSASRPIKNAALKLCFGQGMGFGGVDLGTVGAGEEFEIIMNLEPAAESGMSMWAFTSNGEPIGSLICAQAH